MSVALRRSQRPRMQRAIGVEHLGVSHRDPVAALALDPQTDVSRDVLAAIELDRPIRTHRPFRGQDRHHSHRRGRAWLDQCRVKGHPDHRPPAGRVVARTVTADGASAQVDDAAVIQVGGLDLGRGGQPALIGDEGERGAIGQVDLELGDERDIPPVRAAIATRVPTQAPSVPAITKRAAEDVGAARQQRRDVVRLGQQSLPVGRPTR